MQKNCTLFWEKNGRYASLPCGYIIQYHKLQYRALRVFGYYFDQYEKSYVSGAKVTKSDHSEFNISKQVIGSTSSYSLLVDQFAVWETLFTDRVVLYLLSKTQLWQLHENDQSDLIWNDNAMDLLLGYGWFIPDNPPYLVGRVPV